MRKSKNRYFYHILVYPGDAPGAITLNVVWIKREFDAYKLSRCMCPSMYNRFWDTARWYLWKNRHFIIPLCIWRPLWCGKTRMVSLPDGEKISNISLFVLAQLTNVTDAQTDGHRVTAIIAALCIALHGKKGWGIVLVGQRFRGNMSEGEKSRGKMSYTRLFL